MKLLTHLEEGQAHGDPHGFGFFGAGNHTSVAIGEHDYRLIAQSGPKDALARDIKIIAVHERKDWGHASLRLDCVNDMGDDAPDFEICPLGDLNGLIVSIFRHQT